MRTYNQQLIRVAEGKPVSMEEIDALITRDKREGGARAAIVLEDAEGGGENAQQTPATAAAAGTSLVPPPQSKTALLSDAPSLMWYSVYRYKYYVELLLLAHQQAYEKPQKNVY
eukprot:GABV01014498.1.p1 GENE.GABV01014498.1~~GABV01014498.1.p1  ORF type:complete len:124 (-),score=42.31 GABV01014498.1:55-396(-)